MNPRAYKSLNYTSVFVFFGGGCGVQTNPPQFLLAGDETMILDQAEVSHEYAVTPADVLARRTRLAFLNSTAARLCLPRVVEIMAEAWQARSTSCMECSNIHDGCLWLGLGVAKCFWTNVIS